MSGAKEDKFKSAADIVSSAIFGGDASRALPDAGRWAQLRLALKMAELEEKWEQAAGAALALKSRPAACDASGDVMTVLIHVADQTVLSSVRFRKNQIERRLAGFFGVLTVRVDFKVGAIVRASETKEAAAAVDRRPPVLLSDAEVRDETLKFSDEGLSFEAAEKFARIKLSLEKLSKRRDTGQK